MDAKIWRSKAKGSGTIWLHPDVDGAVVDRHGMGVAGATGFSITYRGMAFQTVEDAKKAALCAYREARRTGQGGGE